MSETAEPSIADEIAGAALPDDVNPDPTGAEPEPQPEPQPEIDEAAARRERAMMAGGMVVGGILQATPMFLKVGDPPRAFVPQVSEAEQARAVLAVADVAEKYGGEVPPWLAEWMPELRCAFVLYGLLAGIKAQHTAAVEAEPGPEQNATAEQNTPAEDLPGDPADAPPWGVAH